MTNATKTLGNCPCCGRVQAVLANGGMSKHGYTVDHGWFNGVCPGEGQAPMQKQREVTERVVASVRNEVSALETQIAELEAGTRFPKQVRKSNRMVDRDVFIPFAEASTWQQADAVKAAIWNTRSRAKAGTEFAAFLEAKLNEVHGQALVVQAKPAAPASIVVGEKRTYGAHTITVRSVEGARVIFLDEQGRRGWVGTQAFRKLALA